MSTTASTKDGMVRKKSVTRISSVVDAAAVVAGERAERDAEDRRAEARHEADQQRNAAPPG